MKTTLSALNNPKQSNNSLHRFGGMYVGTRGIEVRNPTIFDALREGPRFYRHPDVLQVEGEIAGAIGPIEIPGLERLVMEAERASLAGFSANQQVSLRIRETISAVLNTLLANASALGLKQEPLKKIVESFEELKTIPNAPTDQYGNLSDLGSLKIDLRG